MVGWQKDPCVCVRSIEEETAVMPALEKQQEKDPTSTFGALIRDARQRKGWSLAVVGERIGVARTTVGEWEVGKPDRAVKAATVKKLSALLDIDFETLYAAAMERSAQGVSDLEDADPDQFSPQDRAFLRRLKAQRPSEEDYDALLSLMSMWDRRRRGRPAPGE
jgi:transcriptional regulator with XRE-family HTH domain